MKSFKYLMLGVIVFFVLGVINVNAETVTVDSLEDYKAAIANTSTATEIKLGANLNLTPLRETINEDFIYVNRNIVLDLNGYEITTEYATITVYYTGNYTFTIKDSSLAKAGTIHSIGNTNHYIAPIVLATDGNCNPKLILEDITIYTENRPDYMINFNLHGEGFKYDVEISGTTFNNAKQLFQHNNASSSVFDMSIKSMTGINIQYINQYHEYKVSDILDLTKSELIVDNTAITNPEMVISDYNVSAGFEVNEKSHFEVDDVTFEQKQYGFQIILFLNK